MADRLLRRMGWKSDEVAAAVASVEADENDDGSSVEREKPKGES